HRAAIGGLVFDALRRRQSAAWLMEEATPRAILFGALKLERGMGPDAIRKLADGGRFAPAPPTAAEAHALASSRLDGAPAHVRGDYPEWLDGDLSPGVGDDCLAQG